MTSVNIASLMQSYLNLAKEGHYVLFPQEWINHPNRNKPVNFRKAKSEVRKVFKKISNHRSSHRKTEALLALSDEERDLFVRSFMRLVEHQILQSKTTLH